MRVLVPAAVVAARFVVPTSLPIMSANSIHTKSLGSNVHPRQGLVLCHVVTMENQLKVVLERCSWKTHLEPSPLNEEDSHLKLAVCCVLDLQTTIQVDPVQERHVLIYDKPCARWDEDIISGTWLIVSQFKPSTGV